MTHHNDNECRICDAATYSGQREPLVVQCADGVSRSPRRKAIAVPAEPEESREENSVERCYRMALTDPLCKDNPWLSVTIATASWIERGAK